MISFKLILLLFFLQLGGRQDPLESKTDEELVQYFRRTHDARAIAILIQRYNGLIFGLAIKRFRDQDHAQDVVSDIFIKVYEKLQKAEVKNFKSWLGSMVSNHLHDQGRKVKVRQLYESSPRNEVTQIEKQLNWDMDHPALFKAIQHLSDIEQKVVQSVYFDEKSYYEIGDDNGWSFNQVRGARERAIKKLKDMLGNDFGNYFKD